MTKQPKWKYVGNLGDVSPLDYGGYFIFTDETRVYPFEGEKYFPDEHLSYRFILERKTLYQGHLITLGFDNPDKVLPHPIMDYVEWFDKHLSGIASFIGMDVSEYQAMFTSDDPMTLARAYEAIGDYFGYDNLDAYPIHLTRQEAKKRYRNYK